MPRRVGSTRMTGGWIRVGNTPWAAATFDLSGGALGVRRAGHGEMRTSIGLERIAAIDAIGPARAERLHIEIVTTNGAVVEAQLPVAFCDQLLGQLRSTVSGPPPLPPPPPARPPAPPSPPLPALRPPPLPPWLPVPRQVRAP